MSKNYCVVCGCERDDLNWKHRDWGGVEGWGCSKHFHATPHIKIPERIRDDAKKYAKDIIQPFREGNLSREFVDNYPDQVKGMVKEGSITQKEVEKAKEVWK
jgi:hypothetical protein